MKWFLIREKEHLGPFGEKVLRDMFSRGKIHQDSQIWREGLDKPVTYNEAFIAVKEQSQPVETKVQKVQFEEDELPPALPDFILKQAVKKNEIKVIDDSGNSEKQTFELPQISADISNEYERTPTKIRNIAVVMVILIIFAAVGLYYKQQHIMFSRPKMMGLTDFERLKQTASSKYQGSVKYAFALGKEKKSIWISTNSPLEGIITISMKTIRNKILGEPVEIIAKGVLISKLITLEKFQFIKGARVVDGVYHVKLAANEELKLPFFQKIIYKVFGGFNSDLKFSSQALISNLSKKDFSKQLKKYLKARNSNSKLFWEELVQKYQTVRVITGQIKSGFLSIFDKDFLNWKSNINDFEDKYKGQYGVFFTEFVKTNEASYSKLVKKDFEDNQEVLASYNHLSKLATEIGEESMAILESLEVYDTNADTVEKRLALKKMSRDKLEAIIQKCDDKITELSNKFN